MCDLGKGIVYAKDTPNFIAQPHRHVLGAERHAADAGDGPLHRRRRRAHRHAVGWPKSATFRTIDLVGLDILGTRRQEHARTNVQRRAQRPEAARFYQEMLERKLLGDKTKGGFYKKSKSADGERALASIGRRWSTVRARNRSSPALDMAKNSRHRRSA